MKVDGNSQTFDFDSPLWNNTKLLNSGHVDGLGVAQAKLAPFVNMPGDKVMVVMHILGATGTPVVLPTPPFASLMSLFNGSHIWASAEQFATTTTTSQGGQNQENNAGWDGAIPQTRNQNTGYSDIGWGWNVWNQWSPGQSPLNIGSVASQGINMQYYNFILLGEGGLSSSCTDSAELPNTIDIQYSFKARIGITTQQITNMCAYYGPCCFPSIGCVLQNSDFPEPRNGVNNLPPIISCYSPSTILF